MPFGSGPKRIEGRRRTRWAPRGGEVPSSGFRFGSARFGPSFALKFTLRRRRRMNQFRWWTISTKVAEMERPQTSRKADNGGRLVRSISAGPKRRGPLDRRLKFRVAPLDVDVDLDLDLDPDEPS